MDLSTLANLINAFAVTAALIFAGAQITYYRQRRRREAMLELVRSFQSPAFTSALRRVLSLPDGADGQKIREMLGPDGEDAVYLVSLTWESQVCWCFVAKSPSKWSMIFLAVPFFFRGRSLKFIRKNGVAR
jgi:hypothetical protein